MIGKLPYSFNHTPNQGPEMTNPKQHRNGESEMIYREEDAALGAAAAAIVAGVLVMAIVLVWWLM